MTWQEFSAPSDPAASGPRLEALRALPGIGDYTAGPRCHHDHPLRQKHRFMNGVGDEHHRPLVALPEVQ